ncbi:hypothetical protein BCR37DRAFT_251546 [Protomyces lactucae-debilis]|uniref:C2 domain-containing protein n=1 Tax=Protomyces lactucae-debilis TaxID=2754530 RepID=A0A1Y2FLH9_PROLT|nr:uncharacterized protein BCR37DRAFT_251546 [Protomyces lactucae-debilis]ORY84789.1 hypothetical protein BCR37DRAFT_251546 [Protomyces lactucae-debilis]
MSPTYECQIQFVSGENLPIGDIWGANSDPYIIAILGHKTANELQYRTSTCRATRNPSWQDQDTWHVGGIAEDSELKLRVFDEDPRKMNNDRLGVASFAMKGLAEMCDKGPQEIVLKVRKRKASAKVYILTYLWSFGLFQDLKAKSALVKIKLTVKQDEEARPKPALVGPIRYSIHFSPLLGRLAGTKDETTRVACFLAYRLHLRDIPDMRFQYTQKRKEIVMMYSSGVRGKLIRRALQSQHAAIYGFDARTIVGSVDPKDAAARFLEMTNAGSGVGIFTYAITGDGVMHFTQTGPRFAINHLSKHAMHSNAATEVVYSGEFFFLQKEESAANAQEHAYHQSSSQEDEDGSAVMPQTIVKDESLVLHIRQGTANIQSMGEVDVMNSLSKRKHSKTLAETLKLPSKKKREEARQERINEALNKNGQVRPGSSHKHEVSDFTLVIDNSSGTFMPDAAKLPDLKRFLEHNFEGLHIDALAQDDDRLKELKEKRSKKDDGMGNLRLRQASSFTSSSRTSSFSVEGQGRERAVDKLAGRHKAPNA